MIRILCFSAFLTNCRDTVKGTRMVLLLFSNLEVV